MRTMLSLVVVVLVASNVCLAAQKKAAEPSSDEQLSAAVDQLAKTIFATADTNHNHVLNKHEFANADDALDAQVQQMAQAGLIGKPKRQSAKEKAKAKEQNKDRDPSAASPATTTGNKLARSNKVSEAEFIFYVRSVVDEADEYWREARTANEAQLKAYNAARQANPRYRGRGRMPVPYYPN